MLTPFGLVFTFSDSCWTPVNLWNSRKIKKDSKVQKVMCGATLFNSS